MIFIDRFYVALLRVYNKMLIEIVFHLFGK